jgi:DNA-binding phage protein
MPPRAKTGFDKFLARQMRDRAFAKTYAAVRADVDAVDRIVRALDDARVSLGMTKAELARLIAAKPEIVRRLFTTKHANPTLATIVKIAGALGYSLALSREPRRTATRRGRPSR